MKRILTLIALAGMFTSFASATTAIAAGNEQAKMFGIGFTDLDGDGINDNALDADGDGGYVLTRPLKVDGKHLLLNLDAGEGGSAMVQLLDHSGDVIADSHPISGDEVRLPVRWKTPVDLKSLSQGAVQLKIHLKDASLYAFWIE